MRVICFLRNMKFIKLIKLITIIKVKTFINSIDLFLEACNFNARSDSSCSWAPDCRRHRQERRMHFTVFTYRKEHSIHKRRRACAYTELWPSARYASRQVQTISIHIDSVVYAYLCRSPDVVKRFVNIHKREYENS